MASAGRHVSAGGGGNESASCARATRPARTTPKTPVVTKNCGQLRLKTAASQRPREENPTVQQREDRSDRKTRIPIHRLFFTIRVKQPSGGSSTRIDAERPNQCHRSRKHKSEFLSRRRQAPSRGVQPALRLPLAARLPVESTVARPTHMPRRLYKRATRCVTNPDSNPKKQLDDGTCALLHPMSRRDRHNP